MLALLVTFPSLPFSISSYFFFCFSSDHLVHLALYQPSSDLLWCLQGLQEGSNWSSCGDLGRSSWDSSSTMVSQLPVVLHVVGIFVVEFFIPFVVLFHLVLCLWSSTSSSLRFGWVATITCLASCSLSSVFSFLLLQSYLLLSPTLYSVLRTIIGGGTLFSLLDSVLSMFLSSRSTTSLLPLRWLAWLLLSNVWGIFSILQNHSIDSLLYFPFPSSWLLDSLDS